MACTLSLSTLHRCCCLRHNKRLRTLFLPLPASEREAKSRQVKVRVGEDPSPATGLANYDQPAPPPASPARPPACTLDLLHQPPPPYPAAGHLVRGRGWQGGSRPLPCSPVFYFMEASLVFPKRCLPGTLLFYISKCYISSVSCIYYFCALEMVEV